MATGQQGLSFDDLDKFLKVRAEAPSQRQQATQKPEKINDFTDFDRFLHDTKKSRQQTQQRQQPMAPPKWEDVPHLLRPTSKWSEHGIVSPEDMVQSLKDSFGVTVDPSDPRLPQIWRKAYSDIDPIRHPINFVSNSVEGGLRAIHNTAEWMFYGDDKSPAERKAQMAQREVLNFNAALKDPSFAKDPQRKAAAQKNLREAMDHMANLNKEEPHFYDLDVMARAAAVTYIDWETMNAVFKPLEFAGIAAKNIPKARTALYLINQALGVKFGWDSIQAGNEQWKQENYWDAFREWGTGAALIALPLMHHVMSERGITQEQVRQKAYEEIEQKQKELQKIKEANPNAVLPITPEFLEDAKYRVSMGLPMFGIGRPKPVDIPMPDVDALRLGEKNLQNRLERENLKSEAQRKIGELERQQAEITHKRRIAKEQAKTEAEHKQLIADLDARERTLNEEIQREKDRFKVTTSGFTKPMELPTAEKRPFQEPGPLEIRPPEPIRIMTREERETAWAERRERLLDQLKEERQRRLRAGEEFKIEDRRRIPTGTALEAPTARAVEPPSLEPVPTPESRATAALEPMAPPPQTREQIQDKIANLMWQNVQLEGKKSTTTNHDELRQIEQNMEDNRNLVSDLMTDRGIEGMIGRKPKDRVSGEELRGVTGKTTELKTVTANYPVRYRVVEGSALKTSHDPLTFEDTAGYPEGVQERNYKTDKDAQLAVIQHTQGYDPSFTISDSPGPEHGPPMVTPDGIVLGGNSRAMSTMRLYSEGSGDVYRRALIEKASQLGLDSEEVEKMKEPVLVREFLNPPTGINDLRAIGSDLNRVFTRKLSEFEAAVSAGKRLSQETLDFLLQRMMELGDGATLRDLLREPKASRGILEKLEADGVIASTERRAFVDEATQTLNDTGKDFIENAILGSVIDDPLVLANSPKGVLRKIERSLSPIARIKARGGSWDISDYIKEALREHIAAASKGTPIGEHLDPPMAALFPREPIHPIVEGVALKLDQGSPEVKKAFEDFAEDSERDVRDQGTMAFFEPPVPWKSFKQNFGVDVKPEEWGTVIPTTDAHAGPSATGEPETHTEHSPVAPLEPPSIGEVFDEYTKSGLHVSVEVPEKLTATDFRQQARESFGLTDEEADSVMAVIGARAGVAGKSLDQWISDRISKVRSTMEDLEGYPEAIKYKGKVYKSGKITMKVDRTYAVAHLLNDGRTIITAFTKNIPHIASLFHELGHVIRWDLKPEELREAAKFVGADPLDWKEKDEETFARSFERYLYEGKAPTPELASVFEKVKDWFRSVYKALKGSKIDVRFGPDVQRFFDKILGGSEPMEPPPTRREIEIPEYTPKKRYEPIEELPRRTPAESTKAMTDDDLRTAAKSLESQLGRHITPEARVSLEGQVKPFREEMARRKIIDQPERGFGEKNTIFTRERAESARERLRKKLGTTAYSGIDPEVVRDVAEVMGYYFEGGVRELGDLSKRIIDEFGESVRPFIQHAYEQMLNRGRTEARTPDQSDLFKPKMGIILPPGVEVSRGEKAAREERPRDVTPRARVDEGTRPSERERPRQTAVEATRPAGRAGEPATGRTVRPSGPGVGGSGVVERVEQSLRNVAPPRLDVPHITDIPTTVEPIEWKRRLKDANLPETLPPPTEALSPSTEAKLAFKGQPEIVQTALTSLRKYGGAILATSTGTGKTYMGSAIMAELRPRFGMILAPSKNIGQQWIDTALHFGVEVKALEKDIPTEPGIYVTTYSTATNRKGLENMKWDLVIADESHFARRWHDESNKRGKLLVEMGKNSEKVLYTSATPFHTPLELGYFEKLGLWKNTGLENWLAKEFNTRMGPDGKWVVPMNYRKLAALREELISRGMFVNLDRDMRGYQANFAVVPLTEPVSQGIRDAVKAFRYAEEYFKSKNQKKMVMAVRGNAATYMKSYLERQRLPEAIELGKKLENQGWKVIYFTESKKEVDDIYNFLKPADESFGGEISRLLPRLPNVVDTLKEAFGNDLANFTGPHSAIRQGELDDFNRGGKRHLIATYGAGGVGVSLHDLSGDAPRAVIYLGPPWSGVMFDQAVGRPWRFGTKSNVSAYFLTSNAQPEMKLIFQKVLPRFESLKASVSGIKKTDPIVAAMKDLDSYLAYEFGNDTKMGFDSFMNTIQTSAVSSYKEVPLVSADTAKNKGMQVERRTPMESPTLLKQEESKTFRIPADLSSIEDSGTLREERSTSILRRPFISEQTESEITDPRVLDKINDENMAALGVAGGEKPPAPPREIIGNQQIPRPGEASVRREDLAYPKVMKWVRDWAEQHFSEYGIPIKVIDTFANVEAGLRLGFTEKRDASNVLEQFPETRGIPEITKKIERNWARDTASYQYEYASILKKYGLSGNNIAERKIDQALRKTDQGISTMSLLDQPSDWLDGSAFTENELRAAQEIREKVYEPIWQKVHVVEPKMGYRRKYSAVIPAAVDMASRIYPELGGQMPADLTPFFSLEIRRGLTRDPFSPHTLPRKGQPPRTWRISEVLDAYIPSMLKVAHYKEAVPQVLRKLAAIPESRLKEFATKYSRIFFGVPSEYKRMDEVKYKMSKAVKDYMYSGALELNPGWFAMHLSKVPINTWPELGRDGMKYIATGYNRMMTEDGRELVARSGVLIDKMWAFPDKFAEIKKRPGNWLRLTTSMSDMVDRSVAYLAALEKAKDLGFLGKPESVGEITWKRLNELAASGVDTEKAFAYADSVMARSEFFYTPAHVQMWQRERPILGMFSHYLFREMDFISSMRRIAKEVKAQADPEGYIQQRVSEGHYEYIDAVAKYRRLLMSLAGAAGAGLLVSSRFFPFHLRRLLAFPVIFAEDTVDLMIKTLHGDATEKEWKRWFKNFLRMTPYLGGALRTIEPPKEPRKKHHQDFEMEPLPKFEPMQLPQ